MTEEIKSCDCKEKCVKKLKEWTFITSAVFVGTLLAVLLAANILKPKCPPPAPGIMPPAPRMERQLPPPPMMNSDRPSPDFARGPQGGPPPQIQDNRGPAADKAGRLHRAHRPEAPQTPAAPQPQERK